MVIYSGICTETGLEKVKRHIQFQPETELKGGNCLMLVMFRMYEHFENDKSSESMFLIEESVIRQSFVTPSAYKTHLQVRLKY